MDAELMDFINVCEEQMKEIQLALEPEKNNIMNFLQENFIKRSEFKNVLLHGRVKSPYSLREKIIRKGYFEKYKEEPERLVKELPDIIGLRLVCLLADDEKELYNELKRFFNEMVVDNYCVIFDTQDGKHLRILNDEQPQKQKNKKDIYRLTCQWVIPGHVPINVELQIKSLIHVFWGEIEHMLFYKNYSYVIGADFYRKIIDSTYDMLKYVDFQLKIVKYQLDSKSAIEQIEEVKQMLAKLMYNNFSPKIKDLLGCEVDLREIYDIIVQIKFQGITSLNDAYNKSTNLIGQLNRFVEINEDTFKYDDYDYGGSTVIELYRSLSVSISSLAKSSDVYWKSLLGIYMIVSSPINFSKAIDEIIVNLMSYFNSYWAYIENNDSNCARVVKSGIVCGIIRTFGSYKKLDFFLEKVYASAIREAIIGFVEDNIDIFEVADSELETGAKNLQELLEHLIFIQINSVIGRYINSRELSRLKELISRDNMPWVPAIERELLDEFIHAGRPITGSDFGTLFEVNE